MTLGLDSADFIVEEVEIYKVRFKLLYKSIDVSYNFVLQESKPHTLCIHLWLTLIVLGGGGNIGHFNWVISARARTLIILL